MAFMAIGLVLAVIGIDRFTFDILPIGAHVTASGNNIDISAIKDSIVEAEERLHVVVLSKSAGGEQLVSWMGKHVIIKGTSGMNFIPYPPGYQYFTVTKEEGTKVEVNNYTGYWIERSELELTSL
jgi:hypothetical protein